MSLLFEYLLSLFSHWLPLMSAGPFLIDRLATWTIPRWRRRFDEWPHRQRVLFSILLLGVFFAGFEAWKEEHDARLQAEKRLTVPSAPAAPAREPDSLYQLGREVGSVGSAEIDLGNSSVLFHGVRSAGKLDASREVEFRDYVLTCAGLPATPPGRSAGSMSLVSTGAKCTILRRREP
jgi:hypothetical protein